MRVSVFGLGYVGTVTTVGLASRGHGVVGVDVDPSRCDHSSGAQPGDGTGIVLCSPSGVRRTLVATEDARGALDRADISLICVGTPSASNGDTDLTAIERALATSLRDERAAAGHRLPLRGHPEHSPPGHRRAHGGPDLPRPAAGWFVGTGMAPNLREGSGVEDFFAPPLVVVGATDNRTREALDELFGFLGQEIHQVGVETAEALKYACNAFHATKISFANEMGRVLRSRGVDAREVMRVFCKDHKLNIAPTYLRPGFAFGGSCLPKDLRALEYMARSSGVDLPLLNGATLTNELVVRGVVDRILEGGDRRVAILGLSFKMDTDDLRESPNVELAERLIGKGYDVHIYDPLIHPDRLVGANRRYIEGKLPHLNRLLARTPQQALAAADVAVVTSAEPTILDALRTATPKRVIDLHGHLGAEVEQLSGYEGIAW